MPAGLSRRLRLALVGVALVVGAACGEQSNVDPDATVSVSGTMLDTDGSALESRPVRLGSGVTPGEGGLAAMTVGVACLGGACTGEAFHTTTADDGSFTFGLTGRDTRSSFGEAESFLLSTSAAPPTGRATGATVSARFRIQTPTVRLPTLGLVDVRPQLASTEDGVVTTTWDGHAAPAPYRVSYLDPDGHPMWEAVTTEPVATIDGRILEDVTGLATVSTTVSDRIEGSDLQIHQRSSGAAFRGGFGPPPSRGARCELQGQEGSVEPMERCPLTDADLGRAGLPAAVCQRPSGHATTACEPIARVRVVLDAPLAAQLLVVRGCDDPCRIAIVGDTETASDVGAITAPFGLALVDEPTVRAVDVMTEDFSALAEVSVWPAVEVDRPLLPVADPVEVVSGEVADEARDDRGVLIVVAAGMLVLVALLLGIAVGRRSRSPAS